ncbi:hypothetical protein HYT58_00690 [Candidatus Woesearchaeota archaeon]|nr:hypothetical protein [Candidatus Woesearchaeota archaeon]
MTSTIERKQESVKNSKKLDLPGDRRFLLSGQENIEYAIKKLREYSASPFEMVIGYTLARGWGVIEIGHRILPQEEAKKIGLSHPGFKYKTLADLLRINQEI